MANDRRIFLCIGFLAGVICITSCGSSGGTPAIAATIGNAIDVLYDCATSQMTGANLQEVIDEVDARLDTLELTPPAGPAGIVWRGPWQNQDYVATEAVSYQGSAYICVADTTAQQDPTDTHFWQLLASKGADGADGATGPAGPAGTPGAPGAPGAQGPCEWQVKMHFGLATSFA